MDYSDKRSDGQEDSLYTSVGLPRVQSRSVNDVPPTLGTRDSFSDGELSNFVLEENPFFKQTVLKMYKRIFPTDTDHATLAAVLDGAVLGYVLLHRTAEDNDNVVSRETLSKQHYSPGDLETHVDALMKEIGPGRKQIPDARNLDKIEQHMRARYGPFWKAEDL